MKAKKDTKQLLFENMAKLNPSFKLNEDINQWSEWDKLSNLKNNETFTRDDLKLILYTIYKKVYREDQQKLMELLEFFNFGDLFKESMSESPMFGGEKVSQDQYDELQYDKANMEKAMGDAFKTPEGYQMKHPANPGETIQLKDGDKVLVKSIDQATGNINIRLFFSDEDAIKFSPKGYADVSWSPVQFDTIVG
jgi:hypothetical protein